jgi:hypothetical protein
MLLNPWYSLGFEYGYDDLYYSQNDEFGNKHMIGIGKMNKEILLLIQMLILETE